MSELAGLLTERVTIERRGSERDSIGGAVGNWAVVAVAWAGLAPESGGSEAEAGARSGLQRWRLTLRPADVRPGDRIGWAGRRLMVVRRIDDPRAPDRLLLVAEEIR